jgi:hypothetical protein
MTLRWGGGIRWIRWLEATNHSVHIVLVVNFRKYAKFDNARLRKRTADDLEKGIGLIPAIYYNQNLLKRQAKVWQALQGTQNVS